MKLLASLALASSLAPAVAFAPPPQQQSSQSTSRLAATCISKSEILTSPDTTEMGRMWDPLGLAEIGSDETLAWYRHAEIKHGRVAMAAVRKQRPMMIG
jgi:hypothetical protein